MLIKSCFIFTTTRVILLLIARQCVCDNNITLAIMGQALPLDDSSAPLYAYSDAAAALAVRRMAKTLHNSLGNNYTVNLIIQPSNCDARVKD